jgi:hypothetical protein
MGARVIEPELMDEAEPATARACLENLIRINRYFGGHTSVIKLLERAGCKQGAFTLLDVGAASGDSSRVVKAAYPEATVVNLDRNAVNLEGSPHPKLLADAFQLPFPPRSFDYVFSSLFLHHFRDEQIVMLLRGFGQIARRAVLILDLERHLAPYLFLPATKPFFGWHWMTIHDGKISVRAALTAAELTSLAKRAGIAEVEVTTHRPAFRLSMVGHVGPV